MKKLKLFKVMILVTIVLGDFSAQAQTSPYYFCSSGFVGSLWTSRGQNPIPTDQQEVAIITAVAAYSNNLQTIYADGRRSGLWKILPKVE